MAHLHRAVKVKAIEVILTVIFCCDRSGRISEIDSRPKYIIFIFSDVYKLPELLCGKRMRYTRVPISTSANRILCLKRKSPMANEMRNRCQDDVSHKITFDSIMLVYIYA